MGIAGVGGVAIGAFLILIREIIKKNIFPNLTEHQAFCFLTIVVILIWSIAAFGIYASIKSPQNISVKRKTVLLMDSTLNAQIYDENSRSLGRTNADDINEILDDLNGIQIDKEATSLAWARDESIRVKEPDLIIIHHSCFYGETKHHEAEAKFLNFLRYMAKTKTKFLIYTRSATFASWIMRKSFIESIIVDYPEYKNRLFWFEFRGKHNFRDMIVSQDLKTQVKEILKLE